MNRISGLKHYLIYLLALAIIGTGVWIAYRIHGPIQIGKSEVQFQGQITGINWDSIDVYGTYINTDDPTKSDFANPILIKVMLNANNKFVRTIWLQPTQDDIKDFHKPPFLARQGDIAKSGVIDDLRNQLGMLVVIKTDAPSGIKEITPTEVDYSLPTSYTGYGFSGQFIKVEGNNISTSGTFSIQNSPALFMTQGARSVVLNVTAATKLMKTVMTQINPKQPTAKAVTGPVQVTPAQLKTDIASNQNISFSSTYLTNVYGQSPITPTAIYYTVFLKSGAK